MRTTWVWTMPWCKHWKTTQTKGSFGCRIACVALAIIIGALAYLTLRELSFVKKFGETVEGQVTGAIELALSSLLLMGAMTLKAIPIEENNVPIEENNEIEKTKFNLLKESSAPTGNWKIDPAIVEINHPTPFRRGFMNDRELVLQGEESAIVYSFSSTGMPQKSTSVRNHILAKEGDTVAVYQAGKVHIYRGNDQIYEVETTFPDEIIIANDNLFIRKGDTIKIHSLSQKTCKEFQIGMPDEIIEKIMVEGDRLYCKKRIPGVKEIIAIHTFDDRIKKNFENDWACEKVDRETFLLIDGESRACLCTENSKRKLTFGISPLLDQAILHKDFLITLRKDVNHLEDRYRYTVRILSAEDGSLLQESEFEGIAIDMKMMGEQLVICSYEPRRNNFPHSTVRPAAQIVRFSFAERKLPQLKAEAEEPAS